MLETRAGGEQTGVQCRTRTAPMAPHALTDRKANPATEDVDAPTASDSAIGRAIDAEAAAAIEAPRATSSEDSSPDEKPSKKTDEARAARIRRIRLIAVGSALTIGIIVVTVGLIMFALTRAAPSWWTQVNASDPRVIQKAEQLENGVASVLSSPRPPNKSGDPRDPWTVRLTATDANAWLNARLRKWLNSQEQMNFRWPEQVAELRVDFQDSRIYIGAKVMQKGAAQVFTATLVPTFHKDGSLWMLAEDVSLGRLAIPAEWVLADDDGTHAATHTERVSEEIAKLPQTKQVLAAFAGKGPVMTNPIIKLADGRRVRLLGLEAKDGGLLITCQTIFRNEALRVDPNPSQGSATTRATEPPPVIDRGQ